MDIYDFSDEDKVVLDDKKCTSKQKINDKRKTTDINRSLDVDSIVARYNVFILKNGNNAFELFNRVFLSNKKYNINGNIKQNS